jgi:hypothetical protein
VGKLIIYNKKSLKKQSGEKRKEINNKTQSGSELLESQLGTGESRGFAGEDSAL